jgi:hypothetical protein
MVDNPGRREECEVATLPSVLLTVGHIVGRVLVMTKPERDDYPMVVFGNDVETRVEDRQNGWTVLAHFGFSEGAPRIEELHLSATEGGLPRGGVTTDVLRKLKTGPLYAALRKADGSGSRFTIALHGLDPDEDFVAVRRPGRRGRDDRPYALWAWRYVEKCKTTRRPYPELAEDHPGFSIRTIRDLVSKARRRELLTEGSQGKTGGSLTPKAEQLLAEMKGQAQ